ncbi:MAG: VWA domain-containing protein [Ruminococcus flavefaciens]|nr:VWA domain-containing protein [Ruminococcus flavefaciens]MCM1229858.1 VWA domain-containing protein [Ruminococcus flavefaciens]
MGGGSWNRKRFASYSSNMGRPLMADGTVAGNYSAQEMFKSRMIDPALNPYKVIRECCDSEEHPNTVPVILALDVTGSMGCTAVEIAKKLNTVMTELYDKTQDVEFMIMGIGDLACDRAPIQASQFESDIRIAEQLDKIYFEAGGGGNGYESYTGAWYFALNHTKLDCHKRGKKGLIITMGDEPLNPYLPKKPLRMATGDNLEADVETQTLYMEAIKKFELYHLAVIDPRSCGQRYEERIDKTFGKYFDKNHLKKVNLDNIIKTIIDIVTDFAKDDGSFIPEQTEEKNPPKKGFFGNLIKW